MQNEANAEFAGRQFAAAEAAADALGALAESCCGICIAAACRLGA